MSQYSQTVATVTATLFKCPTDTRMLTIIETFLGGNQKGPNREKRAKAKMVIQMALSYAYATARCAHADFSGGHYRVFCHSGTSMVGFEPGSIVLCTKSTTVRTEAQLGVLESLTCVSRILMTI